MQFTWTPHPEIFSLGPISLKWYGFMYLLGFALAYFFYTQLQKRNMFPLSKEQLPDLIVHAFLGMLIGARVFYMLIYSFPQFLENPLTLFFIWQGGMSFHGAFVGIVVSLYFFLKKRKLPILATADLLILPIPLTLFFGRIGNFFNGELAGRIADPSSPLCIIYTNIDTACRYPSQLIQASLEGLLLTAILATGFALQHIRQSSGRIFGLFLVGYGLARTIAEFFREPDVQLGFFFSYFSMGQLLSFPMIIIGLYFLFRPTYASPYTSSPH